MTPMTDFQMMMIHLRTAVTLLPPASSALNPAERRRYVVEKTTEICRRAKCSVLVGDIVELTGLPDYQVVDTLRKSTAFDVFSQGSGWKARLYVKLKEADRDR